MTTTTTSHVGSSLSSASICTHDNPTTHPLACNCETGWVFIIIFFESTNANDDDEPCRLVVVICLHRRPPTSHYDSLGALSPPPPATPATTIPNTSFRLAGASLSPSSCNASHIDSQQVITTRWGLSRPLHLRHQPHRPPSLVVAPVFSCIGVRAIHECESLVSCAGKLV